MVLTEKQRKDLHKGIYGYLKEASASTSNSELENVATLFAQVTNLSESDFSSTRQGILEKKWTSVVRLQRKVMDLEKKLSAAQEDLKLAEKGGLVTNAANLNLTPNSRRKINNALPREPAKQKLTGHRGSITSVAFHPVFNILCSSSEDGTIKVWDHESGEFERTLKGHTNIVNHCSFNSTGDILASCSADLSIKLWDFKDTFTCIKTLLGHDHNVSCVRFAPSNDHLISCSRDKTIRLWETRTGYCVRTIEGHDEWIRSIAVSADGSVFASASSDKTISVWAFEAKNMGSKNNVPVASLKGHEHVVECIAFLNELGDKFLSRRKLIDDKLGKGSSNNGNNIAVEDIEIDNSDDKNNSNNNENNNNNSNNDMHIVSGSRDRTVRIWNVVTNNCLMTFSDNENWVRGVIVHPSGKYVISVSEDRTIRCFDLKDKRCARTINDAHDHFISCLDMHPKGNVISTGGVDKNIHVWECR
jgi:platelet-activating factor acetylhydrolase IB subunit alpha